MRLSEVGPDAALEQQARLAFPSMHAQRQQDVQQVGIVAWQGMPGGRIRESRLLADASLRWCRKACGTNDRVADICACWTPALFKLGFQAIQASCADTLVPWLAHYPSVETAGARAASGPPPGAPASCSGQPVQYAACMGEHGAKASLHSRSAIRKGFSCSLLV